MRRYVTLIIILLITTSCSITKRLPQEAYLLMRNNIKIEQTDKQREIDKVTKSDIESYIPMSQTPNTKILGVNIQTRIFNLAKPDKNNWGNRTLRKIGRPPVLFDSTYNKKSIENIALYLKYRGFFNAEVSNTVDTLENKAYINYKIKPNNPFIISDINYNIIDKGLEPYIFADTLNSYIKEGSIFSRTVLEQERARIYNSLQNNGFYTFSVDAIDYMVDTLSTRGKASVTMNVKRHLFDGLYSDHKQFMIDNIYVDINYDEVNSKDTLITHDTTAYNGVYYISHKNRSGIRLKSLSRAIAIESDDLFSMKKTTLTSRKLYDMNYFKNANIAYSKTDTLEKYGFALVDCKIDLTPELGQGYKIESEVSTNSNFSGISLTLGYTNKNIFKGAEIFDFSVTGSYDFVSNNLFKDSYEFGASASLTFPRILFPFSSEKLSHMSNIGTQVSLSFNTQRRPNYDRTISNISYGYNWNKDSRLSYTYRPISISLVSVPRIDEKYLESLTNEFLKRSYEDQIIAGANFSVQYKDNSHKYNKYSVTVNAESAGNLLYLGYLASKTPKKTTQNEEYYTMFSLRYAQYIRTNVNFVYKLDLDKSNAIVYRLYAGGGYAYGNSNAVPFERLFSAGGSSSMRGWQVRTLGPGNTPDKDRSTYANQLGNIRLETNLEGRFEIYGPLKGAIFLDLGNIWANGKGETNDAGKFHLDTFYKQLALNTGFGMRLDFSFFVIRLDWGIPLHNPGKPAGDRWISKLNINDTALHFAIGYPF